jgi:hypothetical protein
MSKLNSDENFGRVSNNNIINENYYKDINYLDTLFSNFNTTYDFDKRQLILTEMEKVIKSETFDNSYDNLKIKVKSNKLRLTLISIFIIMLTIIIISTIAGILIKNKFPNSENNLLKNNTFKTSLYITMIGCGVLIFFMFYNIFGNLNRLVEGLSFISLLAIMVGIIMFWSVSYKLNILENYIGIILIVLFLIITAFITYNFYYSKQDKNTIKDFNRYYDIIPKIINLYRIQHNISPKYTDPENQEFFDKMNYQNKKNQTRENI